MNSRLSIALSEFSEGRWVAEPSTDPPLHPTERDLIRSARSSRGKQVLLALARLLITFCIGVAATLSWQSYGDAARGMIASSSPMLGWLVPHATPVPDASPDQIKAVSRGLVVVRESVDKLAAEITKLQATRQDTVNKGSAPASAAVGTPGRKAVASGPAPPLR